MIVHRHIPTDRARRKRRGFVLIIVLVVLVVLTLAAYTFTELMQTHRVATELSGRQVQARLLVDSGVDAVRLFLMHPPEQQVAHERVAHLGGVRAGADNRHGLWIEKVVEIATHAMPPGTARRGSARDARHSG